MRERIIKIAKRLLLKKGISEFSIRAICKEAKITAPTIYHHFKDKTELLNVLIDIAYLEFLEHKKMIAPAKTALGELENGWNNYVEFAVAQPDLFRVLCESWSERVIPKSFAIGQSQLLERAKRAVESGESRIKDPALLAQIIWASAHGLAYLISTRPEFEWSDELVKEARRTCFEGVQI